VDVGLGSGVGLPGWDVMTVGMETVIAMLAAYPREGTGADPEVCDGVSYVRLLLTEVCRAAAAPRSWNGCNGDTVPSHPRAGVGEWGHSNFAQWGVLRRKSRSPRTCVLHLTCPVFL
jgi:hypothetical protein